MKRIIPLILSLFVFGSCYEDYVLDYEYSGIYLAFQYDLRSFIIGENMSFKYGAVLGGVLENEEDRNVYYAFDESLLKRDLSVFGGSEPFTAIDGLNGSGGCGTISQIEYVSSGMTGVTSLKPFPDSYYTISEEGPMVIRKGNHSTQVTVTANQEKLLADKNFSTKPYYALAYRITSADADSVLWDKSFEIIALRAENLLFGDWYHGGRSSVVNDADGTVLSTASYPTRIPCDENTSSKYTLISTSPLTVATSYFHNGAGYMIIYADGENVEVRDDNGLITDMGSSWNHAKLLQDRKVFLNYKYSNNDGTSTVVTDTLSFRARLRDGVNEWQDPDPEHYK